MQNIINFKRKGIFDIREHFDLDKDDDDEDVKG